MRLPPSLILATTVLATATLMACSSSSSSHQSYEEMETDWVFEVREELQEHNYPELVGSVNGFIRERITLTDAGVLATVNQVAQGLVTYGDTVIMVDAHTGELKWLVEEDYVFCADPLEPEYVVCTYKGDQTWEAMKIDAHTGQIERTWPLEVTSSWGVAQVGDGLLIMDETAPKMHVGLTMLDSEGNATWSLNVPDLKDNSYTMERKVDGEVHEFLFEPEILAVDSGTIFKNSDLTLYAADSTSDPRLMTCRSVIADDQGFNCSNFSGTTRFDINARIQWDLEDQSLVSSSGGMTAPVVRHYVYQQDDTYYVIDPLSGNQIAPVNLGDVDYVSGFQVNDYALISDYDHAWLIDLAAGNILWESSDEELAGSFRAFQLGDLLIEPGYPTYGFDIATGERLWEYRTETGLSHDGRNLYGSSLSAITKYALP